MRSPIRAMIHGSLCLILIGCGSSGSSSGPAGIGNSGSGNPSNSAPVISGTPPANVSQGSSYAFTPAASDAEFDNLTFSINTMPNWLNFNSATGSLMGTPGPGDVGNFSGIIISVSDGAETASIGPFSVTVTGGGSAPLTITNTSPDTYEWDRLESGMPVYVDRPYIFNNIPNRFVGLNYLRTANDDKFISSPSAITFNVDRAVTVFVGYDIRISTPPLWLQSWTPNGAVWGGSDASFEVYEKSFPAGAVMLGGNEMGSSQYAVALEPADAGGGNTPPAPLPPLPPVPGANSPPVISGSPQSSVDQGMPYSFVPAASDPDGDNISFNITNLPSWASFNSATGALSGTPGADDIGTYAAIAIVASDGQATATLPVFQINVVGGGGATGSALLSWSPPTTNADGSQLNDLAGFRVYRSTTLGDYQDFDAVSSPGVTSFVVGDLTPSTWFFVVTAIDNAGNESAPSNTASKTIAP